MKRQPSFTLLETFIALSLSCVVVFGMLQTYRNLVNYLEHVHAILNTNRKVCLFFNQMERDFNTAFIPPLYKEEKTEEMNDQQKQDSQDQQKLQSKEEAEKEKKKEQEKELEKFKDFFIGTINEQEFSLLNGKTAYPFKSVTFINTNPLQVYGQHYIRCIRVLYELKLDKTKKYKDAPSYILWRRETTNLENVKVKENEFSGPTEKEKANPIRTHLIADNIKELFIEYIYKKEQKEGEKKDPNEPDEKKSFTWGEKKETQGKVPLRVDITISFWNDEHTNSQTFKASFSIFSYPTIQQTDKKTKNKNDDQKKSSDSDTQPSSDQKTLTDTQQAPATAPTTT